MRTWSPACGTSDGSNSTEIVVTEACSVAWWRAPGGDPRRLVRRQQVRAVGRLDLDHAVHGVLDLVEVVVVEAGRQPVALVHEAAAGGVAAGAEVDEAQSADRSSVGEARRLADEA